MLGSDVGVLVVDGKVVGSVTSFVMGRVTTDDDSGALRSVVLSEPWSVTIPMGEVAPEMLDLMFGPAWMARVRRRDRHRRYHVAGRPRSRRRRGRR